MAHEILVQQKLDETQTKFERLINFYLIDSLDIDKKAIIQIAI